MPKPRALGNRQKDLRDESLMKQSETLHILRRAIREKTDPYMVYTEIALNTTETIDLLKRMDTETETI
jgi:hypothetical protein